jgi:hypothetical protein
MLPELIPYSIFYCLQFFIPLLFVVNAVRVELPYLNRKALIVATNITILIAGLLTLFIPIIQLLVDYFGNVEYDQYAVINRYIGPMGMFAWLGLLTHIVLPQMMWNKSFRRSVVSACVWLIAYWVFKLSNTLLLKYVVGSSWATFIPEKHLVDYAGEAIIFLMVIVPVYLLVSLNAKRDYIKRSKR